MTAKKKRNYSETALHIKVADWLFAACPGLLWTHPANQGRSPQEGAKLKKMGVRAGVPDLIFWYNQRFMAIELKTNSSLSPAQKEFKRRFEQEGGLYATCKTVKEVYEAVKSWGITPEIVQIKEPPPPKSEQIKAAIDYNMP